MDDTRRYSNSNDDDRRDINYNRDRDDNYNRDRDDSFMRSRDDERHSWDENKHTRDDNDTHKVLYYLDELSDYKVASDYKDVRGWEVVDSQDRTIGEVDDLLVNKNTERVVYLDVEVDDELSQQVASANDVPNIEGTHSFVNEDGENHLIVPVGTIDIDEDNKKVYARDIAYEKFLTAKWIRKGTPIDREYERQTLRSYFPDQDQGMRDTDDNSFYNRSWFRPGYRS